MTDSSNPWLSRSPEPEPEAPAPPVSQAPQPTGPMTPQRGVPAPKRSERLPISERPQRADLWWLGTHGGAGESSLAELVPQWQNADHMWPHPPGEGPTRVVLTARSNMRGLNAAQAAATQWAAGLVPHVDVLGLVVVADAPGRIPRPLRDYAGIIGGGLPRMWSVPWIESWRLGESPTLESAPRAVRQLIDELHALL